MTGHNLNPWWPNSLMYPWPQCVNNFLWDLLHKASKHIEAETIIFCEIFFIRHFNTLRRRRNEQHFADDIFKHIFFNENVLISIKISLKFVPKGPINNIPALVQIITWRRSGDKPLSEPMMISLPTHICVTRPQWVKWWHMVIHSS